MHHPICECWDIINDTNLIIYLIIDYMKQEYGLKINDSLHFY